MTAQDTKPDKRPLHVAVSTAITSTGLESLCPGGETQWGRCRFEINPTNGRSFDYWIIFARAPENSDLRVAPQNTLFIAGEPPTKKVYAREFYAQFYRIISCNPNDPHPKVTNSFLGLPWHVGLDHKRRSFDYGYDYLRELPCPEKLNKVSVVCSDRAKTAGQRQRLAFLDQAKRTLGEDIVHYGRGFDAIGDKMDGILPFRFHLVLENATVPHYWTEKLSDALLGWSFPIYAGCPNLSDYFSENCYVHIDLKDPETSLARIKELLASDTPRVPNLDIESCRQKVLDEYNPFARFAYWADRFYVPGAAAEATKIRNHRAFAPRRKGPIARFADRLKHR